MKERYKISLDLRKELFIYAFCFLVAFFVNLGAVIAYRRPWTELYSQLGYVLAIGLAFYFILLFFRSIIWVFKGFFTKNNKH